MAKVETEFATLLTSMMLSPTAQDEIIQHMWPLEWLGGESGHTACVMELLRELIP